MTPPGVAVVGPGGLAVKRAKGKLQNLCALLADAPLTGCTGIGHTRWATHGRPSDENAHPHSHAGRGGGPQRHHREPPRAQGGAERQAATSSSPRPTPRSSPTSSPRPSSDGKRDLREAVRASLSQVHGTYAIAVVSESRPEEIVAAKNASPLVVGYGKGENFLASDVPAILEHTRDVVYLEEGELAVLTPGAIASTAATASSSPASRARIEWSAVAAEKDGHKHFMHKEIFEQPRAVADTIRGRASLRAGRRGAGRDGAPRGLRALARADA